MVDPEFENRYRRRREAGEESRRRTRARLVQVADQLFQELGYAATTVSVIAEQSGVSLQTLYLAWGSKRDVFRAAAAVAAGGNGSEDWLEAVRNELATDAETTLDTASYLHAVARVFVAVTARTAAYRRLYREAAAVEPALAEDWLTVQSQADDALRAAAAAIPPAALRPELDADAVFLTLWTLASPEVYDLVVDRAARTPAEFEHWLGTTLIAALTRL
ncbi:helix-turn-helix domain containing protein [Rhodococcus ruber]|uniref:Helix-turn-helix domain containing protein n=1 Tax=Rhodococcus ruber TaxID=1830 RepID=A0ABT4M7F2_9NOCA|nr:TetR/AcrR family transcriptional regulator [Rhodococcus ruber]MCZ4516883.1 helix-turn-helix domain containing protein [Rhodococcus ruber]